MCCRFSPLFMSKSPFFGQLPMAKLYACKREAEGQAAAPGAPRCQKLPVLGSSWGRHRSVTPIFSTDPSCVGSAAPTVTSITLGACPARPRAAPPSFHPPWVGCPGLSSGLRGFWKGVAEPRLTQPAAPLFPGLPSPFHPSLGPPHREKPHWAPVLLTPRHRDTAPPERGSREPGQHNPSGQCRRGKQPGPHTTPTPVIRGCQPHIFFISRN